MATRRYDYELTKVEMQKRMAGWKDRTLAQKLRRAGITLRDLGYSQRSEKNILAGKQRIGAGKRKQMEKLYLQKYQSVLPASKWLTVEAWINQVKDDTLNRDFSIGRLHGRGFFFVYVEPSAVVFTNRLMKSKPKQPQPAPQHVIYSITVEDANGVETWIQASTDFYYGVDPTSRKSRMAATESVKEFQMRNEDAKDKMVLNNEVYSWWNHFASEAVYRFVGIGVTL